MNERTRKLLKGIAVDLAGGLLIAVGIYNFALNANFPLTGVSGICLILYRLVGLPIGLGTVLINIPIAAVCYKLLGRGFFLRSVKSMLISTISRRTCRCTTATACWRPSARGRWRGWATR